MMKSICAVYLPYTTRKEDFGMPWNGVLRRIPDILKVGLHQACTMRLTQFKGKTCQQKSAAASQGQSSMDCHDHKGPNFHKSEHIGRNVLP